MNLGWTDEQLDLLRTLWNDGWSASQIAAELGSGITLNAVIGKIHRLGIAGRAKTPRSGPRTPRTPTQKPPQKGPSVVANVALAFVPVQKQEQPTPTRGSIEELTIPLPARVTLLELGEGVCRWPLGEPQSIDFRFCGARSTGKGVYCSHHAGIAYRPGSTARELREARAASRKKLHAQIAH